MKSLVKDSFKVLRKSPWMKNLWTNSVRNLMMMSLAVLVGLLSSCSGSDYLNAIPVKSTAVISVDMPEVAEQNHSGDQAAMLKSLLHVDDASTCGLDISERIYLFESADGNLGLCAKVKDDGDVADWLGTLAKKHICTPLTERKGFHFTVLKNSWLVGFSDEAFLVMGPVVADAQAQLQQQMVKYLKADQDMGITSSPMFERLSQIDSPMAMVAQAQALPEKFVAPFTLGAPKDTDPSQVVIAADMSVKDGMLLIHGETFSFNKDIDDALQKAQETYRPIKGQYVKSMPSDALAGIFMNVNGEQFLPMMQSNRSLQTLLMGINQAVDMDNIIRSVDGDMAIVMPSLTDADMKMMMGAKLAHSKWLGDVDYWKQSCPAGAKIANWGKNSYFYTDGKTSFYFGVTDDLQFFSGSDQLLAQYAVKPSNHPIDPKIQNQVIGQKLAMVVNLGNGAGSGNTGSDALSTVTSLLSPIFGNLTSVVYTLK